MHFDSNNSSVPWDSQLDPHEKSSYVEFFRAADTENKGVLLKDEAITFFKKANIPINIINEIWEAADREGKGFLTDQEFCIALKLIACAQHGIIPASPVITTKVPLPQIDGIHIRSQPPDTRPSPARGPTSPSLQPASNASDTILPDERAKYINLFRSSGPVDGVLIGERAKDIFSRSNLPNSTLAQIWALADTRKSGALNQTEFIIAMHYISRVMQGGSLPPSLPATVYAAAASGRVLSPVMSSRSPTLRRQGTVVGGAASPAPFTGEQSHHPGRGDLDISEDEFAKYKVFFDQIDTNKSGFISGNEAVVFFRHSKLPESDLARIWDLADTRQVGQLNLQQFAVAMHLINRRLAGGQIPTTLTDSTVSRHPSFMNAHTTDMAPPQPSSAAATADLLGLSGGDVPLPASPQQQQQGDARINFGAQRAGLESTLSEIRSDTQNQIEYNEQLRSRVDAELQAIHDLQEAVAREKEALEALKRAAKDTERELEQKKHKKSELTQELQVLKQEKAHYQKRLDSAQSELQKAQSPVLSTKSLSPEISAGSISNKGLFSLSSGPSNDIFAPITAHRTGSVPSLASPPKAFDPYAGLKESKNVSTTGSAASSPIISLNRLKEDTENRHMMRSVSPNVDISAIEAKFPDLTTMEHQFQPARPSSPAASAPPAASNPSSPQQQSAGPKSPRSFAPTQATSFISSQPTAATIHASPSGTPKQSFAPAPQPGLSPSQAKSVAKYGFDLSAFEDTGETSSNEQQRSVKDDLTSLFSSPTPAATSAPSGGSVNNFDDIFGVRPSPAAPAAPAAITSPPERKPTFDEMFFS
ncbi:hypothetical protein BX666DRAFT_1998970 [Dichotomocladium elegans]|nr:hypothetical protein BX666DRAFT_1998970 [Dichotomocladium elegans]